MDDFGMADAIADALDAAPWKATYGGLDEIHFTNEDGEKFVLRVEKVAEFPE